MANKKFDDLAKEKFRFLELDFKFKLTKCKKEDWGFELIYMNSTTGVKISYEFQEAYIFITLYQLVEGKLIENPVQIKKESTLFGYGLDDIVALQNPSALIKPAYEYGDNSAYYDKKTGLELYVSAFAKNLKNYATVILSGDFMIFDKLEEVVKKRV